MAASKAAQLCSVIDLIIFKKGIAMKVPFTYSILFIVGLLTLNTSVMAQKGFQVTREITIHVSADELWEMVGPGFVDVYKWSSNVDHAEGKGNSPFEGAVCDERFCDVNVKGFSKISEKLVNYDEEAQKLSYKINSGMPGFVTHAQNNWSIVAIDDTHSKLVMNAEFEVKGFMGNLMKGTMKKQMTKTLETVLQDAKVYLETGNVSEAKAKRIEQLDKKRKKAA